MSPQMALAEAIVGLFLVYVMLVRDDLFPGSGGG